MQKKKIVLLVSDCESSRWVYNSLKSKFSISHVLIEQPVSKKILFMNRVKKIGVLKVSSQAFFSLLFIPYLKWKAKKRREELIQQYQLDSSPFDENICSHVLSVNADDCRKYLQNLQPDIVLVNGTRIISKKTLQCINAVFINMHVGITPWYRGSHGGYWALYNNDVENFGTTIHLVDTGVDTGRVLQQAFAKPGNKDNFTTYPVIQVAEGIKALIKVVQDILNNNSYEAKKHTEKGRMYYQPTVWEYLKNKTR